jgi:ABC-type transport system substrate-binding protein
MEKEMKRVFLVLFCFLFILNFTKPRYGGQLIVLWQEPLSLNPYESSFSDLPLFSLLWTNIMERIDGKFSSAIFQSWEYNKEKRAWRFILKEGLLFSNGSPISSSDIKRSIELYMRSEQPGSKTFSRMISGGEEFLSGSSGSVKGIVSLTPSELLINLRVQGEDFLDLLSSPYIFLYTGSNVFSGPYILSSWEKGDSLTLKPNPYFGRGRVFLDGIKVFFKRDIQNFDFGDSEIKGIQFNEFSSFSRKVFMFFNPQSLNHTTRVSLYLAIKNKFPKNDLFELSNSYIDTNFTLPFFHGSRFQSSVLPELQLNVGIEKGLEGIVPFLEKIFRDINIKAEFVFIPSFQIKKIFDSPYFQMVIFFPNPSPFYSEEKELIHYIEEYEISRFDENFLATKKLLSELESVTDADRKVESLFYIQKNMIENAIFLPFCKMKTKFYLNKKFEGLKIDDYGKPVFWGVRMVSPL